MTPIDYREKSLPPRYTGKAFIGKPGYGKGRPWHKRVKTWTSRDGQVTKLEDLADSHLENIILFLRNKATRARRASAASGMMMALLRSFDGIPDDVLDDMTRETYRSEEELLAELPIYRALCREADRRAALLGFVPARDTPLYPARRRLPQQALTPEELEYALNDGGWGDC